MIEEEWIDGYKEWATQSQVANHVTKWRNTNKEYQRIQEKRALAQVEIDTQVAEFASKLQGVEPEDFHA
jgi:hypothetical protein